MTRRVCMLLHGPFPVGEPRVAREARAAVAAGYEVDIICMRRRGEPARELLNGILIHRLPFQHERGLGLWAILREYLGFTLFAAGKLVFLTGRRRYRLVQVHNPPDFLLFAALPAKLLFRARLVFDVHDLSPDMFAERFSGTAARIANLVLPRLERLALRLADEVITVHEPYARELQRRGAAGKVTVVMNSVDPGVLPTVKAEVAEEPGFRVVYHGTITPWYGVDLVLEATREITSDVERVTVDIYGEGDALPALRQRARQLELDGCVRFHDQWLSQTEVLAQVRTASAGVIPNRPSRLNRYALSSKLLEYVELGVPVAAAALPTLREHFGEDEVLFFTPGDPGSLARALLAIARDPAAARKRADAARRRARAYAWEENARRYLLLLDRVAADRNPSSQSR